jgi:site-specific recombinase XerD
MKYTLEMSGLKKETCESYVYRVDSFLKTIEKDVYEITLDDVLDFLRTLRYEKNYAIGTVNYYRTSIKYFYEAVLEKQWINRKVPRLKGYKPLPAVLSRTETIEFIKLMDNEMYRIILYTMYSSGLRIGEAVSLKVKNIDSKRMQIYIEKSKSGRARYAILSEKNLSILRRYILKRKKRYLYSFEPDDFLFPSNRIEGSHISKKTMKNNITKIVQKHGIKKRITSHTLRHCFASHLLESGVDIFCIKELLGHSSIQSTNVYLSYCFLFLP